MGTVDRGFTLVELMVVVLVIGILVAIAVPVFNAAKASAERNVCFANQRALEGVYQQYKADTGTDPVATQSVTPSWLLSAGYLKSSPTCPSWSRDTTFPNHTYYFKQAENGDVWVYRHKQVTVNGVTTYPSTWTRGCPIDLANHGYYRTPEVN